MLALPIGRFRTARALPRWAKCAAAAALVVLGFAVRLALDGFYHYPFLTFIPVVLATALLFGSGTGVLAALLSAAAASYFFDANGDGLRRDEAIAFSAFIVFGVFTAAAIETLFDTVERLEAANQRLAEAERAARAAEVHQATLLDDVGHRLKNSLHALAGTLSIDAARLAEHSGIPCCQPDLAQRSLEDAAARLRVLARVHERLHLSGDRRSAVIEMRAFLTALAADLSTLLAGARPIELRTDVEAFDMSLAVAVPVGLIINELTTNAVKHAFPDGRSGVIWVRLRRSGGYVCLEVQDNGTGVAAEEASRAGTGRRLVATLARQLGGKAEWHGPPGMRVAVRFPV